MVQMVLRAIEFLLVVLMVASATEVSLCAPAPFSSPLSSPPAPVSPPIPPPSTGSNTRFPLPLTPPFLSSSPSLPHHQFVDTVLHTDLMVDDTPSVE